MEKGISFRMEHLTRRMAVASARGFTLMELIMVMVIAGILTSTLMSPFFTGVQQGTRPEIYATALYLAQEEIETKRSTGYNSSLASAGTSTSTSASVGTRTYTKQVVHKYATYNSSSSSFDDSTDTTKEYQKVTVTVSISSPSISVSLWTILAKDFYAPNPNA